MRERGNDILHQTSHLLTAKAGVIKFEALNIKGMMRDPNLALSVADPVFVHQGRGFAPRFFQAPPQGTAPCAPPTNPCHHQAG
jgi:hypothetical protein